jgi:hypothetical protein
MLLTVEMIGTQVHKAPTATQMEIKVLISTMQEEEVLTTYLITGLYLLMTCLKFTPWLASQMSQLKRLNSVLL